MPRQPQGDLKVDRAASPLQGFRRFEFQQAGEGADEVPKPKSNAVYKIWVQLLVLTESAVASIPTQ